MAARFANGAYVIDVSTSTAVGGGFAVLNPEGTPVIITQVITDVAAASSSTANIDIGFSTASNSTATTVLNSSNALNAAAAVFSTAGGVWSTSAYLTGSLSNAAGASLNANVIVKYHIRST